MDNCTCCAPVPEPEKEKNIIEKLYAVLSSLPATIVSGVFTAISLTLHYAGHSLGIHLPVDPAWVAVVVSGYPLLYSAIYKLAFSRGASKISSSLLISIAMIAAIAIGELFAAGQVAFIMAVGGVLEDKTLERAQKGIKNLINLVPAQGRVIKRRDADECDTDTGECCCCSEIDGSEMMVPVEQIQVGDILRVLPGEAIPVDGEIINGNTSIDQSIITGESLPIDKTAGDCVHQGTINRFGSIEIKATGVGTDSSLSKLIALVHEAENNKAPTQLIVDKWAVWLVPLVFLIAAVTYAITHNVEMSVTIMIVFCPCALALATPTAIVAAIGQAAKHGVIIKSGEALENMGKVDLVTFDKTGTLTCGGLIVSDLHPLDPAMSEKELLTLAASVESHSEHPIGRAITAHAKEEAADIKQIKNFAMIPGKGISAEVDEVIVLCGSSTYLQENDVNIGSDIDAVLDKFRNQGKAAILVARGRKCVGVVALSDTIRANAKTIVQALETKHTSTVLLTGDNEQTASYIAGLVGVKNIHAELLPAQKVDKIHELQSEGHHVCMIGDGVNDAPALKMANVGVAMGGMGSDIAIDAADIALISDDITNIPYLKRLSNATVRMIYTNISISIVFNLIALTLSFLSVLNPVTGALAHNAGSIAVVLNAALLYDRKI